MFEFLIEYSCFFILIIYFLFFLFLLSRLKCPLINLFYQNVRIIKACLDGTHSKVRIGNYLSSSFPIENGLKQEDGLLSVQFCIALCMCYKERTRK